MNLKLFCVLLLCFFLLLVWDFHFHLKKSNEYRLKYRFLSSLKLKICFNQIIHSNITIGFQVKLEKSYNFINYFQNYSLLILCKNKYFIFLFYLKILKYFYVLTLLILFIIILEELTVKKFCIIYSINQNIRNSILKRNIRYYFKEYSIF